MGSGVRGSPQGYAVSVGHFTHFAFTVNFTHCVKTKPDSGFTLKSRTLILHICQTCHRASASSAEPPTDIDAKPAADAAESGAEAEVAAVRVQVEAAVNAAPERPQPREDLACLVGLGLGLGLAASSWCFGGYSSAIQQYTPVCRR